MKKIGIENYEVFLLKYLHNLMMINIYFKELWIYYFLLNFFKINKNFIYLDLKIKKRLN